MQKVKVVKVTRKEGDNTKGHWVNTRVTGEDGSVFGTFHTGAAVIKEGDLIELNPIVKDGKTNFEEWNMLEVGPEVTAKPNGFGKSIDTVKMECESRERIEESKRISIEGQTALNELGAMIRAEGFGLFQPADKDSFHNLWKSTITKKLGFEEALVPQKGKTVKTEEPIDMGPLASVTELFDRAKNYGLSQQQVLDALKIGSPEKITIPDNAWKNVARKLLGYEEKPSQESI